MTRPLAVITGASRGIGAAVALRLAQTHDVDLLYRERDDDAATVAAQAEALGARARTVRLDVTDVSACADYGRRLDAEDADVAVLVNNAAVTADALLLQTTSEDWEQVLATNLTGPFAMIRALVPLMMDRRGGAIVNVSSNSAVLPGPGQAAYAATKGGLEALTRASAVELRRLGIRVNAVRVGRVRTEMSLAAVDSLDRADDAVWGEPDDIADVIAFLASDAARYVTGQVLVADGGLSVSRRGTR